MKRDNWKLGNGIQAGDDALFCEDGKEIFCHVIKVSGGKIKGYEEGNIEVQGLIRAVLG